MTDSVAWGRRTASLALLAGAGLIVWFAFAIVTPYMIDRPPGPDNTSFGWYLAYESVPLLLMGSVLVLMLAAWRLVRPWTRWRTSIIAASVSTVVLFVAALVASLSRN